MKQKHLYALLDKSYTTIAVIFLDAIAVRSTTSVISERDRKRNPEASPFNTTQHRTPWDPDNGRKRYTYKVDRSSGVKVGDEVVVERENIGFVLGRVVRVDDNPQIDVDASFDYKWIVQRVDASDYRRKLDNERLFSDTMMEIERVRQRELMLQGFHATLPEGSEARRLFDSTIQSLTGPAAVPPQAPPSAPNHDAAGATPAF